MTKTFIIAEAGVNHNGKLPLALELIDIAYKSNADAIKFQIFVTEKLVAKNTQKAQYQITNTNNNESQYDMLKKLELSYDDYTIIKNRCDELHIEFISTPFDIESVDFLNKLGVDRFKIASGDLTNYQLLKHVALTKKPVILSTGMSDINEVNDALNYIKKYTSADIAVLHCISSYPTITNECNLLSIKTMMQFKLPIGLSDHTLGYEAAMISVALGATLLEKHFTINKMMDGPDHKASLDPEELTEYINKIRETEIMLGDGNKRCMASEENTKTLVRRSIAVNRDIRKGEVIKESDIICLRPNAGISSIHFEEIIGRKIITDLTKNAFIKWSDVDLDNLSINSLELDDKYLVNRSYIMSILDTYLDDNQPAYNITIPNYFSNDKCIIIGNGPSLRSIDLPRLQKYTTIACNYFFTGIVEFNVKFIPSILCAGDRHVINNMFTSQFNLLHNNARKYNPIIVTHISSIQYNKPTLTQKINMESYEDIYNIHNFERFDLSRKIPTKDQINNNVNTYCVNYRNVIPMISMLIAEKLGFKEIYLIGVDFDNIFDHFYSKHTSVSKHYTKTNYNNVYNGFKKRYDDFQSKGINVYIENKKSLFDFIPTFDINELY